MILRQNISWFWPQFSWYQNCLEEGTLTCLQTSVLADNQGGDHGNTPSFGVAAEMKLHEY
jgi:hypothetical protein